MQNILKNQKLYISLFFCLFAFMSGIVHAQDVTPPDVKLTDISVSTTESSAKITFVTAESATSEVDWDVNEQFRNKATASNVFTTSHTADILHLSADTRYFYRTRTKDAAGNESVSISLSFVTKTASISPVEDLPRIINVQVLARTENLFRVSWKTAKNSIHWLEYGKDSKNLENSTTKTSQYTSVHSQELKDLESGITYYYRIHTRASDGKTATSPRYSFETLGVSAVKTQLIEDLKRQIQELKAQIVALLAARIQQMTAQQVPSQAPPKKADEEFQHTFIEPLYYGLSDDFNVKMLQEALSTLGYFDGPKTGNFFGLTFDAVKKFQGAYGISTVGRVGPQTRAKLNELFSKQ